MGDIYFKKDKKKFKIGHSDVVFKYKNGTHNLDSCRQRFIECDKNGKPIKKIKASTNKEEINNG